MRARYAPVAQLDRVLGYEPRGQGFESLSAQLCRFVVMANLHFLIYMIKRNAEHL